MRRIVVLLAATLAAFSFPASAQSNLGGNNFPVPGGATAPGVVLLCDNGSGLFVPCKSTPPAQPATATSITLNSSSLNTSTTANANTFISSVKVTATSGTYAGTLTLGGPDAALFALSNGGVYPTNLRVGKSDIARGPYNINITAP